MAEQQFKNLFSPGKIGKVELTNRIVLSSHNPSYWRLDEGPNERARDYYIERVKGGVGLIVLPMNAVSPPTSAEALIAVKNDKAIPNYKMVSEAIHEHGAKVFGQLMHPGVRGNVSVFGGSALGPSSTPYPPGLMPPEYEIPHEMEIEEIKQLVDDFAGAALRLQETGYDGVEISSTVGAGGLLVAFLSPYYNKRTDEYGGSFENRLRLHFDILDAIRDSVGPDFVVGIRLVADELLDGGLTLDDAKTIAPKLAETGQIDYLSVCAGIAGHIPPMYYPLGCFVHLAVAVKEVVDLPIICHARINDPVQAEQILSDHQADFVGMARALICDPEWPKKAKAGKIDEIRKCISCNQACIGYYRKGWPVSCALNPAAGKEKALSIIPAETSKNIVVVGGGAAGLEAARVAALRGHRVTLFEQADELGGQLNIASKIPGRLDFDQVPRYYTHQMDLLNVKLILGVKATAQMIKDENPDTVVIATGSTPVMPSLPGGDGENVVGVRDVLQENTPVGQNVVIIADEHHEQALGAADFLADKGKNVQVLCPTLYAGGQLDPTTLPVVYSRLLKKGVVITPITKVTEIQTSAVITAHSVTGEESRIDDIDTVVYAANGEADDALYRELKGDVGEIHRIGQCLSPRKIQHSIWDGARVGRLI
ncbi:FAD-dependent oxidoreductase [Thermodesulfobacteriota bacterium]